MPTFTATPITIGTTSIIHLPKSASQQLPSRGMVYAKGTINNKPLNAPLEPDGQGSHWFESKQGGRITLEATDDWPEPPLPKDIKAALKGLHIWKEITVRARWEWLRWIRDTKNPETRKKRINVMLSKFKAGNKRPCCFDTSRCTRPELAKSGVLNKNI